MGHQPEYRQSHSHEQIEPVPSFGWEKEGQIAFHRFACRNLSNPERLISHAITPPKKVFQMLLYHLPADCLFYISFFHNDNSNTSQQHSVYYKNSCDNRKPFSHRHYLHSLEHCYRPIHRNHITVPDCIFNTMNNVKPKNQ